VGVQIVAEENLCILPILGYAGKLQLIKDESGVWSHGLVIDHTPIVELHRRIESGEEYSQVAIELCLFSRGQLLRVFKAREVDTSQFTVPSQNHLVIRDIISYTLIAGSPYGIRILLDLYAEKIRDTMTPIAAIASARFPMSPRSIRFIAVHSSLELRI
jgi:hypothetical protein